MPKLAAFPKAFMDALCVNGSMTILEWVRLAATLDIDGLEFYAGFLELEDPKNLSDARKAAHDRGLEIPMFCCSPDFTHPDPAFRRAQVQQEQRWIDMAAALGARFCRVLSGQARPEVSREDGLSYCQECIAACLDHAAGAGITLVIENHYKDNYWTYREFTQRSDVFCDLLSRLDGRGLAVNFDPSNALLAGEDPLELLKRIKHRVATMHASDRYLPSVDSGNSREGAVAVDYATQLRHGEIGRGLNDYDAIFAELSGVGFDGWISIEDGVDGIEQLDRSAKFLRAKIHQYWPS